MANNSMGQAPNMPTIGTLNQGTIQYANNPLQSPQLQSTSLQGSPSQHSPMSSQAQAGAKTNTAAADQAAQVSMNLRSTLTCNLLSLFETKARKNIFIINIFSI
jgi:hypothetical protein